MSFRFGGKIVTDGLISYLDIANTNSYSGTGTIINDLTSNGNSGSLINGASYNGLYAGNITCDGNNDYIEVGGTVTSFTLNIIYQPLTFDTNTATGRYNCIVETNNGAGSAILLRYNTSNSANQLLLANHGSVGGELPTQINHTTGTIYDVSITYDDTSKYLGLYYNGALINSRTMTAPLLYTGLRQLGYTFNARFFNYKVYNRALSLLEIQQNHNVIKPRFGL